MNERKIGIVIVTFNNIDNTLQTLETVSDSNFENKDIVVVDNGSDSFWKEKLEREIKLKSAQGKFAPVEYMYIEKDSGYGSACNKGAEYLIDKGADILFFLNNDVLLDKECIAKLARNLKENTALAGPKVYLGVSPVISSAGGFFNKMLMAKNRGYGQRDYGQYDKREEVEFINGCAFMILAAAFKELEGFDEQFRYYYEETDLCYRAIRLGYKIIYEPEAVVYHKGGMTFARNNKKIAYNMTRSRILFIKKHSHSKVMLAAAFLNTFYDFVIKFSWHWFGQVIASFLSVVRGAVDCIRRK